MTRVALTYIKNWDQWA